MEGNLGSTVSVSLPALMFYIPFFREFVADTLLRAGFSERFAYRTEVIVDELCSNAVRYGSRDKTARIEIRLTWFEDHINLSIIDEGGSEENIAALKEIANSPVDPAAEIKTDSDSLGLEIVKMLSEKVVVQVNDKNITSVKIVRNKEDQ